MALDKIKFFAAINADNVVENITTINYSDRIIEYSHVDDSITNNAAQIGKIYDAQLNAFISPKPEDETYIFNLECYEWEPNPELEYVLGGQPHKWDPIEKEWNLVVPPEETNSPTE